jgi:hypothetical protein
MSMVWLRGNASARVIRVVELTDTRGHGTEEDVVRTVVRYFSEDGEFLAEYDHRYDINRVNGIAPNEDFETRWKRTIGVLRELRNIAKPPYGDIPASRLEEVYNRIVDHIGE